MPDGFDTAEEAHLMNEVYHEMHTGDTSEVPYGFCVVDTSSVKFGKWPRGKDADLYVPRLNQLLRSSSFDTDGLVWENGRLYMGRVETYPVYADMTGFYAKDFTGRMGFVASDWADVPHVLADLPPRERIHRDWIDHLWDSPDVVVPNLDRATVDSLSQRKLHRLAPQ